MRKIRAVALSAVAFVGLALSSPGVAAPITVTTTADILDDGDNLCSLREAIIAANTNLPSGDLPGECPAGSAGQDVVLLASGQFQLSIPGPPFYSPATGDLDIVEDLVLSGNGPSYTIIDAGGCDGIRTNILDIVGSIAVEVHSLTLRGGVGYTGGGVNYGQPTAVGYVEGDNPLLGGAALQNLRGEVLIENVHFQGNLAQFMGGAIYNAGHMVIRDSVFAGNDVLPGNFFGGPYREPLCPPAFIEPAEARSLGAAIANAGVLLIDHSTFLENGRGRAVPVASLPTLLTGYGGAIENQGTLVVDSSAFVENAARIGSAISSTWASVTEIGNSTVSGNMGWAAYYAVKIPPMFWLPNRFRRDGQTLLISVSTPPGFPNIGPTTTLAFSTITASRSAVDDPVSGGGYGVGSSELGSGSIYTLGSIIAANGGSGGVDQADCLGGVTSLGHNVFSRKPLTPYTRFGIGCVHRLLTDLSVVYLGDPTDVVVDSEPDLEGLLSPLADNGGGTLTHSLPPESAAIDMVPQSSCLDLDESSLSVDQRGILRPADGDLDGVALCDAGAFERVPPTPADAIERLHDLVGRLSNERGIVSSLDGKIEAAMNSLADAHLDNDVAAGHALEAFINTVRAQRGSKLTDEEADFLIAAAQAIIDLLLIP